MEGKAIALNGLRNGAAESLSEGELGLANWVKTIVDHRDVAALREACRRLRTVSRLTLGLLGVVWDGIASSACWKDWGYTTLAEAMRKESPISRSWTETSISAYRYCRSKGMSWQDYLTLAIEVGVDKIQLVKFGRVAVVDLPQTVQPLVPADFPIAPEHDETGAVVDVAWIRKTFCFTPDMLEQVETAVKHFQDHYADGQGGMACSESAALAYICGDYLSRYGRS